MTLEQLIQKLTQLQADYGNLEVVISDGGSIECIWDNVYSCDVWDNKIHISGI